MHTATKRTEYPRPCPRCGGETRVVETDRGTDIRECTADCPWWLYKGTVIR